MANDVSVKLNKPMVVELEIAAQSDLIRSLAVDIYLKWDRHNRPFHDAKIENLAKHLGIGILRVPIAWTIDCGKIYMHCGDNRAMVVVGQNVPRRQFAPGRIDIDVHTWHDVRRMLMDSGYFSHYHGYDLPEKPNGKAVVLHRDGKIDIVE